MNKKAISYVIVVNGEQRIQLFPRSFRQFEVAPSKYRFVDVDRHYVRYSPGIGGTIMYVDGSSANFGVS